MTGSPVALVEGGGGGVGAAVARRLLDAGHRVAVTWCGEERLRGFTVQLGRPDGLVTVAGSAADRIAGSIVRAIRRPEGVDADAVVVRPIGLPSEGRRPPGTAEDRDAGRAGPCFSCSG
ncbi:Diacetyl reductase [(S)-acetoin forming] [Streptomyces sp. MBT84]|uniref:hypothetical protein n=1 Tax=unclassified Streptomyces TaxID=2593676 RepID=UPI001C6ED9E9|nr:Diacetyl reductase [(S)-acetoin forming] [Streptomyces sp. MBT84]